MKKVSGAVWLNGCGILAGGASCAKASPQSIRRMPSSSSQIQESQWVLPTTYLGRPGGTAAPIFGSSGPVFGRPRISVSSSSEHELKQELVNATFFGLVSVMWPGQQRYVGIPDVKTVSGC